jgi:hypothetical protein
MLDQLREHDVVLKQTEGVLFGPDGQRQGQYLERQVGVETLRYPICIGGEQERLVPSMIRSICAALDLDPADFGLELG